MLISLDTECTGLDIAHGAMPYLVTTCDDQGVIRFWEWDVDPLTRIPQVTSEGYWDIQEIQELIDAAELIYFHNSKFDIRMLATIGITVPWEKVRDSVVMGHLLASNHRHNLTDMCIEYLHTDIEKYELSIKEVTRIARGIVKKEYPNWKVAREGETGMPSVKESSNRDEDRPWKNDMWLPRALIKAGSKHFIPEHWATACSRYANADSEHTLPLGLECERLIRENGLWAIYEHRLNLPRIAAEMEDYGTSVIGSYTEETIREYELFSVEAATELTAIATEYGHDLQLAAGASLNDNMREFFYGSIRQHCPSCNYDKCVKHWNGETESKEPCPKCAKRKRNPAHHQLITTRQDNLALSLITNEKSGNASLDKEAMGHYLRTLEGTPHNFIRILSDKRKHDTSLGYMQSYQRFWVPITDAPGFYRLHPSLNPCGTDHLRWSSNSPNLQNVGKQEQRCDECEDWSDDDRANCCICGGTGLLMLSARNCFGPAPGREWYSMDFASIEDRIPAYECGEPALIELFEKPNDPPYWGSNHNLTCSLLWPDKYFPLAEKKCAFKDRYINEYKRAKNTNFAKNYGAGRGKIGATAGIVNAYDLIDRGKPLLAALQAKYLRDAEETGWITTLPDRSVDPTRGYPILAGKTEQGRVLSTTPFNYHVSGTACWAKNMALIRCSAQCATWRREGFDARMCLEIHDEILFDFPRGRTPDANRDRAQVLRKLMEQSGEDLIPRIPLPVSVEYHNTTWARGVAC